MPPWYANRQDAPKIRIRILPRSLGFHAMNCDWRGGGGGGVSTVDITVCVVVCSCSKGHTQTDILCAVG